MNHSNWQRRGFTVWQVVIVLGILALLAAVLFPIFFVRGHPPNRRASCLTNLKQIMLGVKQYVQDYDGKYPLVVSGPRNSSGKAGDYSAFGWADAIYPYVKSTQIFQCPSEETAPTTVDALQPQYTDYWFNARASGVSEKQVWEPAQILLLGDGNDGTDLTNARYHLMSIPAKWRGDVKSPLYRHTETANFAFADGHVKSLKGSEWKNGLDFNGGTKATFRLKAAK